jgi:hypothetical protein
MAHVICGDELVELVEIAGLDDRKGLGNQLLVLLAFVAGLADATSNYDQTYDYDGSEKPSPGP